MNKKKFVIFALISLVACHKSARPKSVLKSNPTTVTSDTSGSSVTVDIECKLVSGASYRLPLLVNNKAMSTLSAAITTGSYVGHIVNSRMNAESDRLKMIDIRSAEMREISKCLAEKAADYRGLNLSLTPPTFESFHASNNQRPQVQQPENTKIDLQSINNDLADIRKYLTDQKWGAAYEDLIHVTGMFEALKTINQIEVTEKTSIQQTLKEIKDQYVLDGMMKCDSGGAPLVILTPKGSRSGTQLRHLANLACFSERKDFKLEFLSYVALFDGFLLEYLPRNFNAIVAATNAHDLEAAWRTTRDLSKDLPGIKSLQALFASVSDPVFGELRVQKLNFAAALVRSRFGQEFSESHAELVTKTALLLTEII